MEQVEQQHQKATKQLRPASAERTEQQPRARDDFEVASTQSILRKSSRQERRQLSSVLGKPASTSLADLLLLALYVM
eukprot:4506455-Amphidinium_carterae.1